MPNLYGDLSCTNPMILLDFVIVCKSTLVRKKAETKAELEFINQRSATDT